MDYENETLGVWGPGGRFTEYDDFTDYEVFDSEIAKMSTGVQRFIAVLFIGYMVMGLTGNFLTILALLRCPRVRNVTAAFIISLCVADFLFCVLVLPWEVSRFLAGRWIWGEGWICTLFPLLRYWNVAVSLLSIAMITINRYIMIAHFSVYKLVYRKVFIAIMIAFCWVFAFVMLVPTLLKKWGRFGFDRRLQTCSIIDDDNKAPKQVLFGLGFCVPAIVIVICYSLIFIVIHKSEKRMRHHSTRGMNGSHTTGSSLQGHSRSRNKVEREARRKRNEWRITKMVLIIFIAFLITYLPITLVKNLDKGVNYPGLHVMGYVLIYISSCINPIIYVIMNRQYRQAYKTVLLCKRPRLPSLTSSHSGYNSRLDKRQIRDAHCNSCISEGSLRCMENSIGGAVHSVHPSACSLTCSRAFQTRSNRNMLEASYHRRTLNPICLLGFETPDTQSIDAISLDTSKVFGTSHDCCSAHGGTEGGLSHGSCLSCANSNRNSSVSVQRAEFKDFCKDTEVGRKRPNDLECSPQNFISPMDKGDTPSSSSSSSSKKCSSSDSVNLNVNPNRNSDSIADSSTNSSNLKAEINKSFSNAEENYYIDPKNRIDSEMSPNNTTKTPTSYNRDTGPDFNAEGLTAPPEAEVRSAGPVIVKKKSLSLSAAEADVVSHCFREKYHSLADSEDGAFSCTLRHKSRSSHCLLEEVNLGIYERHASWAPWTPANYVEQSEDNPVFQE
ncbi:G-protein coupled receptor moody-like isoform X2 [Palaemon carinicauda]|uniref:G-protein coupled receptor moody-like isoform X2 n=1 Tax=Palaemon carinicauda TaxID=392227 RepID=UPI0035B66664